MAEGKGVAVENGLGYEFFIIALFVLLFILCGIMYKMKMILTKSTGYILLVAYFFFIVVFSVVLDFPESEG